MTARKPCAVCAAYGARTLTSAVSSWTVEGGVRIACHERPVCRECQRQAAYYPTAESVRAAAARALRAIPSEARSEQSRANGRKGGRPAEPLPHAIDVSYAGQSYRVKPDGSVMPWDSVAGHFTHCHSLAPSLAGRVRAKARRITAR